MKPVNLNKVRKAKERAEAKTKADENAVRFGRSKVQRAREETKRAKDIIRLDQHKRDG